MPILDYFPRQLIPRPEQVEALLEVQDHWDETDVFVVSAPTALGKTALSVTIATWAAREHRKQSAIITPTRILTDQYLTEFPETTTLKANEEYRCEHPLIEIGPRGGETRERCGKCEACVEQRKDLSLASHAYWGVYNYWVYHAYRLHKHVLIADEAHNLLEMLKELACKKYWQHEYKFPSNLESYGDLLEWAEERQTRKGPDPKIRLLIDKIKELEPTTLVRMTKDWYRGNYETCIKLLPLTARACKPFLWPTSRVRKILLLSATIGPQDIADLGLDGRKVHFVQCKSPIHPQRRPVVFTPVADMSLKSQEESVVEVASMIEDLLHTHSGEKGLIHATYAVSEMLQDLLDDPRLIWHTKWDRTAKYKEFRASSNGVLVACGLQEGVDLAGDFGRWQVLTQVPYPSLEDPAIEARMRQEPEWYRWQAVRSILQACGRISRTVDDYGATYILDTQFERLYTQSGGLFPGWFKEAITGIDNLVQA